MSTPWKDPEVFIPRVFWCGGRYWTGYAWASCTNEAPAGQARCDQCQAAERARKEAAARDRAAEIEHGAQKRRRKAS